MVSNVFRKTYRFWDNVEKYGGTKEAADGIMEARGMLNK